MTLSTRTTASAAATLAAALVLAGCGSSGSSSGSSSDDGAADGSTTPSASPSQSQTAGSADSAQQIAITVKGDTITPTNKRIAITRGKPVIMVITSDRTGELHVHSSPEQHIDFDSGTTRKTVTFDQPGVVEVEEHKSDTLIAQLEVR